MVNAVHTVKNKVFDTRGIENFIIGSRIPTKGISKKALLEKRESPVLRNHVIILWKIITSTER